MATSSKPTAYVYLMRGKGDLYKIGWSMNLAGRAVYLGLPLDALTHSFPCSQASVIERKLHAYFASKRVQGEWFRLSQEDIAFISSIHGDDSIPAAVVECAPASGRGWGKSDNRGTQINVRLDEDTIEMLNRLVDELGDSLGIRMSQASVIQMALTLLERHQPHFPTLATYPTVTPLERGKPGRKPRSTGS